MTRHDPASRTGRFRPARLVAAGTLAAALTAGLALPAVAVDDKPGTDPQTALANQYMSLSGALLNLYASNAGMTLSQYLESQQVLLSPPALPDPVAAAKGAGEAAGEDLPTDGPAEGSATPEMPAPTPGAAPAVQPPSVPALGTAKALGSAAAGAKPVTAATLTDLNKQLTKAGVTIDTKGYANLDALARDVVAKSNTLDGTVTLAGAKWMSQLATLRTPNLKSPSAAMPAVPGLPKDALVFGLFANKSLTSMLTSSPDLFKEVGKSGVGSPALQSAWNKSMMNVYNSTQKDLNKMLPDACTGAMLAVMASGDPKSGTKISKSGCSPACVTGGLYLNSQTSALFAPNTNSALGNPFSTLWNGATLNGLQDWQRQQLIEQNPQVTAQLLRDTKPVASASCAASAKATSSALGTTLPGIFGQLRTK